MTEETRPDEGHTTEEGAATRVASPPEEQKAKLNQNVEVRDVGPCRKHLTVTIERADIEARLAEQFSKLVADSNVAGFRPGKAPRKIVERRFAKDVHEQVKNEMLYASLEQLAETHDLAPLSPPDLDPRKIVLPKDGPMVYEFEVEVRPDFDLPAYRGLKLKRPIKTFTDDDVDQAERRVLAPFAQVVPKPEGNAQIGDILVADVTSRFGDRVLGTIKETTLRIEKKLAFKDGIAHHFADQVKGASAGDSRSVGIQMSSAVADTALRGQTVQATFDVKDVKALRLPDMTPEFLHRFSVSSPEQLRERLRYLLDRQLEHDQRQSAREQVLAHIASAASWDLPEDLLRRQARKALARRVMEMRGDGISEEEINKRTRLLQQDVLASTALMLKEHFVLQKIAEVEKIEVDEDDIDDEIERLAAQSNESPRRLRAKLEKEDMLDSLAAEMVERKVLDLILNSADYEDVPLEGEEQPALSTVEEQAVPGQMEDLSKETPPPAPASEGEAAAPQ